ncbi:MULTISPECIES: thioredoxin domain-containing protein [Methylosinus]|uniref:Thioredoxin domain-containing protein n=1 Tax=Methylosinus trichosporium (strain ATCC 35070 / NCIMB 11131 / UNIQEM 75 / OB3b) TaxID=595536 RepID=A0A2D2D5F8_METT3|nr:MULTISPECIES: thioredoxin domain-containing protein [Methylosinus]ATQ70206.1 thioredoxin domain-containing protein [Methylosinus trichosporium OB3b]OBS54528.1 thymidylate kinase [Methylosinus sp. 3S-1]
MTDSNRLSEETSPYLLQHKDNPVHWRAWSAETLALAKAQGKPILLSSGYAACHWCHVMAAESFENDRIAALMNANFINVKVDREERPDIDHLYQQALQMLGRRGGWPLTMFLTPDGEPFWGGTYFPPEPRHGMPGFADILQAVAELWREKPAVVTRNVGAIANGLDRLAESAPAEPISPVLLETITERLEELIDREHGGIRGAPKFPQPPSLEFLWRAWKRTGRASLREAVLTTLDHICQGGIYDHIGGGFARYSTDERWLAPHFEKMLYDNGQLVELLTLVWQDERKPLYAARVEETIDWALREMRLPEGVFASSLDADSEHEEGKFYVWSAAEIDAALGERAGAFRAAYDVTEAGNWEEKNIPNRLLEMALGSAEAEAALAADRAALLALRETRVRPGRDDKALADWNGLMIAALAAAAQAFARPDWLAVATAAFDFIATSMTTADGRLLHSYRAGRAKHMAVLDDYADLCRAALTLHEATGDDAYLTRCREWAEIVETHYRDPAGGYFFTADDAEALIRRAKIAEDAPLPSGNGAMTQVLARLYHLTGETAYRERAEATLTAFAGTVRRGLLGYSTLLSGAEILRDGLQIVIIGARAAEDTAALLRVLHETSLPGRSLLVAAPGAALPPDHPAAGKTQVDGRAAAYMCRGTTCSLPIVEPASLALALRGEPQTPSA